jgi:hypothetical protein
MLTIPALNCRSWNLYFDPIPVAQALINQSLASLALINGADERVGGIYCAESKKVVKTFSRNMVVIVKLRCLIISRKPFQVVPPNLNTCQL